MRNRIIITILLTAISAVWCFFPHVALNAGIVSYQQGPRKRQSKRTVRTERSSASGNASRDYSKFSHRSDKHKSLNCSACHKAPTDNWQVVSRFPDIADYPAHDACTRCHRPQFFKGALPVICSNCHTKVSPRGRDRFAFGKPNQPSQFRLIFPHDKHQDVIASNRLMKGLESAHAARRALSVADEEKENYNNCTICHETQMEMLNPQGGFPDNFKPPPGTFKTAPSGHASCFNCHWKNQEPTHEDCVKCHGFSETDSVIQQAPARKSLKFNHLRVDHVRECTACHINITRVKVLFGLKPDVPISSCAKSSCHGARLDDKTSIQTETSQRGKQSDYVCKLCHTPDVGKRPPPASHDASIK